MVQPQIGIGNRDSSSSNFDAIDLLEDDDTAVTHDSRRYTIDSDGEESSEEEGGSSSSGEEDEDVSCDEASSSEEEDDPEQSERGDVDSVALTEVASNVLNNPPAQHHSSPIHERGNKMKKPTIPPASSFRNIGRRFPSYMLKGSKRMQGKDKNGSHSRLSTIDQDNVQGDEESHSKPALMRDPINSVRDPSKFPMEQFTDVRYGVGQDYVSYSYASSDPSSVHYEPKSLRLMEVKENDMEERKRRIVFWGLLTAIFISLIIAISSIVAHAKRQRVIAPPSSLENLCDISSISTQEGHLKCESLCEEAKCCMAPGSLSCFAGQEDICSMYAPCAGLYTAAGDDDLHVMVPPAPADLDLMCSFDSIKFASGYSECTSSCQAGLCCFKSPTIDFSDSGLASSGFIDLPAQKKSCSTTHIALCNEYHACDNLKGLDDVHGSPIDLVNSKCALSKMNTEQGIDECETACQPRSCCFAESKKRNCYDDNKVWCDDYSACKILVGGQVVQEEKKNQGETITHSCSKDSRDLSISDFTMCKKICDPATCCFYDDTGCSRNIDCDYYAFCSTFLSSESPTTEDLFGFQPEDENIEEILPPSGGQHNQGPSPSEVETACKDVSPNTLEPFEPFKKTCSKLCMNYSCCFEDDYDPASCHEKSTCDKFSPCKKLVKKEETTPNPHPSSNFSPDACSIDNLSHKTGFAQCEEYCDDHLCCFQNVSCKRGDCSEYESCKILANGVVKDTDKFGVAIFDYSKACSDDAIEDINGKSVCSEVCDPHKCCWNSDLSCPPDYDGGNCNQYEPCKKLYKKDQNDNSGDKDIEIGQETNGDKPLANVNSVCEVEAIQGGDTFFVNACIERCDTAKCCYDGTCDHKTGFCEEYSACSSVSTPSLACSEDTSSKKACKNACNIFSCCWEEGGCFASHEHQCELEMRHCEDTSNS